MIITSLDNIIIKEIYKLVNKKNYRKKQKLFIIDGQREIKEAIKAGIEIDKIIYCKELATKNNNSFINKLINVNKKVFQFLCYKKKPDGYLAVAKEKEILFKNIKLSKNPLIIVLESIEKPGNLGAIIRTAYAAQIDLIIINDERVDIYNPNVIRASEGKIFFIPIIKLSKGKTINYLKEKKIQIVATNTKAKQIYSDFNFKKASAIVLGAEDKGLSEEYLSQFDHQIIIPMIKEIDSLNLSVSAAIIIYEAKRQRGFI